MANKSDIEAVKSAYKYVMDFRAEREGHLDPRSPSHAYTPLKWMRKQHTRFRLHPSGGPAEFMRAAELLKDRVAEVFDNRECQHLSGCAQRAVVDCKTTHGPWGYFCPDHYEDYGIKLGLGFGQVLIYVDSDERPLADNFNN